MVLDTPSASKTQNSLKDIPRDVDSHKPRHAKNNGERAQSLIRGIVSGVTEVFSVFSSHFSPNCLNIDRLEPANRNWSKLSLRSRSSSISSSIDT